MFFVAPQQMARLTIQLNQRKDSAMLRKLFFGAVMVLALGGGMSPVGAGTFCTTVNDCRAEVRAQVRAQDQAAARGSQWGPVGRSACAIASREQEANERRCRSYDLKPGGKTRAECAKCYRQVREDIARWEQCYRAGYAPRPPRAIYESLARLGAAASR